MTGVAAAAAVVVTLLLLATLSSTLVEAQNLSTPAAAGSIGTGVTKLELIEGSVVSELALTTGIASVSRRRVIVAVRGMARFNPDRCGLRSSVTLTSNKQGSDLKARANAILGAQSLRCNSVNFTLTFEVDSFFTVASGGEIVTLRFEDTAFAQENPTPDDRIVRFNLLDDRTQTSTGLGDTLFDTAYGFTAVSVISGAAALCHPTLMVVPPRAAFLYLIAECAFDTTFTADVYQYPWQIPFTRQADSKWFQFYAIAMVNGVALVLLCLVVLVVRWQYVNRSLERKRGQRAVSGGLPRRSSGGPAELSASGQSRGNALAKDSGSDRATSSRPSSRTTLPGVAEVGLLAPSLYFAWATQSIAASAVVFWDERGRDAGKQTAMALMMIAWFIVPVMFVAFGLLLLFHGRWQADDVHTATSSTPAVYWDAMEQVKLEWLEYVLHGRGRWVTRRRDCNEGLAEPSPDSAPQRDAALDTAKGGKDKASPDASVKRRRHIRKRPPPSPAPPTPPPPPATLDHVVVAMFRRRFAPSILRHTPFWLPLFSRLRPGRQWFVMVEMAFVGSFALLESTRTSRGCVVIAAPAAVLGATYLAVVVAAKPFFAPIDQLFHFLAALVYTLAPFLQSISFWRNITGLNVAASYLILLLMLLTVACWLAVAGVLCHDWIVFRFIHRLPTVVLQWIGDWRWDGEPLFEQLFRDGAIRPLTVPPPSEASTYIREVRQGVVRLPPPPVLPTPPPPVPTVASDSVIAPAELARTNPLLDATTPPPPRVDLAGMSPLFTADAPHQMSSINSADI